MLKYLVQVCKFTNDLLQKVYKLPPYYNVRSEEELIGHLIIGFAPHTSAGVMGRVLGFTKTNVCYAHPLWHNIKRRDCDGDEDAIMLVLDVLLNFSKAYLPAQIGGMMDAPLLLISVIDPFEVDEAQNLDVASSYPLAFYETAVKENDYPAQVMLQWFVNEQVEEEKNASELIEQLKMSGDQAFGALFMDKHVLGTRK
jgi:DNA polymerase II large subunit